mmetsp:Transcript_70225/g.165254  ORF Transcript_70225/g.165254 Transcript_70225/m.165254 type:complete len:83 (-) Transcript_70225:102-350(-)
MDTQNQQQRDAQCTGRPHRAVVVAFPPRHVPASPCASPRRVTDSHWETGWLIATPNAGSRASAGHNGVDRDNKHNPTVSSVD